MKNFLSGMASLILGASASSRAQDANPSRALISEAAAEASSAPNNRDYLIKFIDRVEEDVPALAPQAPPPILPFVKSRLMQASDDPASIYSDPRFVENYARLTRKIRRIVSPGLGTRDVSNREFLPCVAVGNTAQSYFGTGTIIAPKVVLTAAHVALVGPEFIFIGDKTTGEGRVVRIESQVLFDYDQFTDKNDIALLILSEETGVQPATFAPPRAADHMTYVRVVGFGYANGHQFIDTKRLTDVPVFSHACDRPQDAIFGGHPGLEFIAADPHGRKDTCNGDSGGPAFTLFDSKWMLVGVTSRATVPPADPDQISCGDGGIYTRIGNYLDRIQSSAAGFNQPLDLFP